MVKSNIWWGWSKNWRGRWNWHCWRWGQWPKQRDRRHKVTRHIVRSNWSCDQSQMLPTTSTRWPVLCSCCKQSGLDVRPKKHLEHYSVWQSLKGCSLVDNVTLLGTKGEWGGGGGPAFDTFSPGKAGSINKLCDEGAFEKRSISSSSITMLVHGSPNQSRQRQ